MEPAGSILVAAVGIEPPVRTGVPWLRCTDGTTYRMPAGQLDWALGLIAAETEHQRLTGTTMFPLRLPIGEGWCATADLTGRRPSGCVPRGAPPRPAA
ncbi:hypothetical protein ACWDSJ_00825 [Nocardia sp. NPDC003482]